MGLSDDSVIEATTTDRRWEMVLDCMGAAETPFSKGTLVGFRQRLIESDLDRRLIERTIELARKHGGFGAARLRAALDSSPLLGAGRVEDSYNLMGHALRKALGVIAGQQGRGLAGSCPVKCGNWLGRRNRTDRDGMACGLVDGLAELARPQGPQAGDYGRATSCSCGPAIGIAVSGTRCMDSVLM